MAREDGLPCSPGADKGQVGDRDLNKMVKSVIFQVKIEAGPKPKLREFPVFSCDSKFGSLPAQKKGAPESDGQFRQYLNFSVTERPK